MKKNVFLFALAFASGIFLQAQEIPFHKGVQFTNWFQAPDIHQLQFTKYTKKDFEDVKRLGCDVVRLPINLHFMTSGAPDYVMDTLFYYFLDQVVGWSEDLGMYLILDNHTFNTHENTTPEIRDVLKKVWSQMADHYKGRSKFILYEVYNEPHDISDELWNDIQGDVIRTIRQSDTVHTVIAGPSGWNSYLHLDSLQVYDDDKVIYTFHFYTPFLFTHQGATWTTPSMGSLAGIPFPYNADRMPPLPDDLKGTWVEAAYNDYDRKGTEDFVRQELDIAINFQHSRNVPLFCGEFGVYMKNSNNSDRVYWYGLVREYLEENNIPWLIWDYHGGFGLFNKGGNDLFEHDLNVPLLEALGLDVPEQTEYIRKPDSTGFMIYTDYAAPGIDSYPYDIAYDLYATDFPNNGVFCLKLEQGERYGTLFFDFRPDKDLSRLFQEDYALDMIVRSEIPGHRFDIRFVDTKTDVPGDHPWRMKYTLDETTFPSDGRWHHLFLPLSEFEEGGAWDDGWYDPEGKFDWTAIDRFEVVNEYDILHGDGALFFDNIHVTNQDTAQVYVEPVFVRSEEQDGGIATSVRVFPNPVKDRLVVENVPGGLTSYYLLDLFGRALCSSVFRDHTEISFSGLKKGVYFLRFLGEKDLSLVKKVIKE